MVNLSVNEGMVTFEFTNNDRYLQDGTIEVPVNSLMLVTDESEMFTFRKSTNFDIFISGLYSEIGKTKAELETYFKENMVGSTGGGSTADTEALKGVIDRSVTSIDIPSGITSIGNYALANCTGLTSIDIPSGITTIGNYAFYYCSGLTDVDIADSVTSIGNNAFYNCTHLTSANLGNGVTTIGTNAFANCYILSGITIPNSVTTIGSGAFNGCSDSLTSIDFPSGVTTIEGSVLNNCRNLSSVTISNNVTSIGDRAFGGCMNLTRLNSNVDGVFNLPSGITTIGSGAFNACNGLTNINIPSGVTSIESQLFYSCTGLTSVDIPSGVTTIKDNAFYNCSSLTSINIPSGVTAIQLYAFNYCTGLTSITVNRTTPPTLGNSAFNNTNNCPIYVPAESVDTYKAANVWRNYASRIQAMPWSGKWLATYSDSSTSSAACDSSGAIEENDIAKTGLISVEIGDCTRSIGVGVFDGCTGLTSIVIPDSVTSIGDGAFYECSGLTSIDIPSGVTTIGNFAFNGCTSLSGITVNRTTHPTLGNSTFNNTNNCPIYVPAGSVNAYKHANGWRNYASRIQAIPTPTFDGKWIGYYSDSTSYSATCDSTSAITKNEVRIGNYTAYTKVIIGDCVTRANEAFQRCSSMTDVEIGSGVTTDLYYAFEDCTALTAATWYATSVDGQQGAFQRCTSLQKLVMYATTPPNVNALFFNGVPSSMIIYVPDASVSAYQSAQFWSNYTIKGHSQL